MLIILNELAYSGAYKLYAFIKIKKKTKELK